MFLVIYYIYKVFLRHFQIKKKKKKKGERCRLYFYSNIHVTNQASNKTIV